MHLGKKLKLLRVTADVKTKEMAAYVGRKPCTVTSLESREDIPTVIKYIMYLKKKGIGIESINKLLEEDEK